MQSLSQENGQSCCGTMVEKVIYELERIKRDARFNSVIYVDQSVSLELAREADSRNARGEIRPLDGLTFTVKDNLWIKGWKSTFGSILYKDFIAEESSWIVDRLIQSGAIPIGITACSELACMGVTNTPLHGITAHPADLSKTPGGSSGGAVTAVARNIGDFAVATDAGGSIRRPAGLCGVVGFKPTLGAIPNPRGFKDPNFLLNTIGFITREVHLVKRLFEHSVSVCCDDPLSVPILSADIRKKFNPGCVRAVYIPTLGGFKVDQHVSKNVSAAVDLLRGHGLDIVENDNLLGRKVEPYELLSLQNAALAAFYSQHSEILHPNLQEQIELGKSVTPEQIFLSLLKFQALSAMVDRVFDQYDFLFTLSNPVTAWEHADLSPRYIGGELASLRDHAAFTPLFNYAGCPAINIPLKRSDKMLSVGIQVIARKYRDWELLDFAEHISEII
ncbi:amidase [Acidithiobacillus sp. IBUN Pt1247-S3]|uniref:amidase n=1 Tax=Acidithiobacillus sp. IBUN Pt1247-S3 TaxID=3166642 RepID=UPI0034E3BE24